MRQEPRPQLEQRYKPGFIWYPTLDPRSYTSTQLICCTRCGNYFCQKPEWRVVEIPDAYGDFHHNEWFNVASTVCASCHRKTSTIEPKATEVELEVKQERTKFRRRGAKHTTNDWRELAERVRLAIRRFGPMTAYEINEMLGNPSASGNGCKYMVALHVKLFPAGTKEVKRVVGASKKLNTGNGWRSFNVQLWGLEDKNEAGSNSGDTTRNDVSAQEGKAQVSQGT